MNESLNDYGLEVKQLKSESLKKDDTIADLRKDIKALNESIEAVEPVIVFQGYDKEYGLGEDIALSLTDNQLEVLADYEVDVDGEDISVEESLKVNAYFNKEDKLSLMFDEESVQYVITYDAEAAISEDEPMKMKHAEREHSKEDFQTLKDYEEYYFGKTQSGDIGQHTVMVRKAAKRKAAQEDAARQAERSEGEVGGQDA